MVHGACPAGVEEVSPEAEVSVSEDLETFPALMSDHAHPIQTGLAVAAAGSVLQQYTFDVVVVEPVGFGDEERRNVLKSGIFPIRVLTAEDREAAREYSGIHRELSSRTTSLKIVPENHLPYEFLVLKVFVINGSRGLPHVLHHIHPYGQIVGEAVPAHRHADGRSQPCGVDCAGTFVKVAAAVIFLVVKIILKISPVGKCHLLLGKAGENRRQQQRHYN